MTILTVINTHDYRSDQLSGSDQIDFQGSAPKATFDAAQFDDVQISHAVFFNGLGNLDRLTVELDGANTFSGADWVVWNWSGEPFQIHGNAAANTITGTETDDVIDGGGGG